METIGIDMAADPKDTAAARLVWADGQVRVVEVWPCVEDELLGTLLDEDVAKIGVDCPLGWPDAFVTFVTAHRDGAPLERPAVEVKGWRRELTLRLTDREVARRKHGRPLSVSADRIAHPTLRLASVLSQRRSPIRRDGSGVVVEVYPAAALTVWGLPSKGYKRAEGAAVRSRIVEALTRAIDLDWGTYEEQARTSDHVLDAVVCGLVARAAKLEQTTPPDQGQRETALREGWIHVPTSSELATLTSAT